MVASDQQDQGDEGPQNGQIDHLIAVDREPALAERKGVKEPVPPACYGKEVHHHQSAIADQPEKSDGGQKAQQYLDARDRIDLEERYFHILKMLDQILVLFWCDHLVGCPEENEPRQTQAQNQKRDCILLVITGHLEAFHRSLVVIHIQNTSKPLDETRLTTQHPRPLREKGMKRERKHHVMGHVTALCVADANGADVSPLCDGAAV